MFHWRSALFAVAVAAVSSCGGAGDANGVTVPSGNNSGGTSNPGTNTNAISVSDNSFSPATVTIPKGVTVTWTWTPCDGNGYGGTGACASHNVTFDDGSNLASPSQNTGTY